MYPPSTDALHEVYLDRQRRGSAAADARRHRRASQHAADADGGSTTLRRLAARPTVPARPIRLLVAFLLIAGLAVALAACSVSAVPTGDPGPAPTVADLTDEADGDAPPTDPGRPVIADDCDIARPTRAC
jgi:hypothetical protein